MSLFITFNSVNIQELIQKITDITIWKKGDQRAPHKPLLLLYVLSQYRQGHERLFNYGTEIEPPLFDLLNRFGPQRNHYYPNMPFWRLQRDGFWQLTNIENCINSNKPSKEPTSKQLISCQVYGGFDEPIYQYLTKHPLIINQLAEKILNQHFPESVQENLINQLEFDFTDFYRQRDPKFRQSVLRAYNYQCAICSYDLRHDSVSIGLEAAHVKWKQHGGPCIVNNGLALCSLHHSAFDMGVIGLNSDLKIKISNGANGNQMVEKLFWDFDGKKILLPRTREDYLHDQFIEWHFKEVFRK
jgi:putative restriction endonuclease